MDDQSPEPPTAPMPSPDAAGVGEEVRQHYAITLAVLAVAALAYALLQTMVVPALPEIQRQLHSSTTSVTWVLTVYLLAASIATPVLGRLGDMFGKERVLVCVLLAFAAGCAMSALSHSLPLLVTGRAVQGAGGAVFPLAFGIIRDEFPAERVATGIGLISAVFGVGGGAGLLLSGLIVDHLSYEWIFWFGLLAALLAATAAHLFVPESPVKTPGQIDWTGTALLSGGLVCLLLAISEGPRWGWHSGRIVGLFLTAAAVLWIWAVVEGRIRDPLVDMTVLRLRGVWTTNLAGLLIGFGMFGSFVLIPGFVQTPSAAGYGFGATATGAGLFLLPSAAVMLIAGPLAGALGTRAGSRLPLQIGAVVATGAFVLLAAAHTAHWHIYLASLLLGAGIGFSFAAMANLIVEAVPQTHTGQATGINSIARTIGGAFGAQIAATLVSSHLDRTTHLPAEVGYTNAFVMSAIGVSIAFLAALAIPGRTNEAVKSFRVNEPR